MKVTISGDTWIVTKIPCKEFVKLYGKEVIAICTYNHTKGKEKRLIHFSPKGLQISTIRHELCHAYLSYIPCADLTKNEMEEIYCDLIGGALPIIERIARRIKREL